MTTVVLADAKHFPGVCVYCVLSPLCGQLRLKHRVLDGTHMQLWHLMRGLYDVIPSHLISVFDYQVGLGWILGFARWGGGVPC